MYAVSGVPDPTMVVTAWARCGHCDELLTQLGTLPQEPQYYTVDLLSGLFSLQLRKSQKAGEGL